MRHQGVLERQEDAHIKVEIQSHLEFQSVTSSPTRSIGPHRLHIDVQYQIWTVYICTERGRNKRSNRSSPKSKENRIRPELPKQFQYPESNSSRICPH
jgi:hypothetical protein